MASLRLSYVVLGFTLVYGCGSEKPPPMPWTTGFWFWHGSSAEVTASVEDLDALYFKVGPIQSRVYAALPAKLPEAHEFWLVYRFDQPGIPVLETVPVLADSVRKLRAEMRQRGMALTGIQLDVDSPTRLLNNYARYLSAVRKELPADLQLSITALLDWFRSGTGIANVLRHVDEHVPQFYDARDTSASSGGAAIAERLDGAKWGPMLNRYRKRFRIGVSTFGRARLIRKPDENRNTVVFLVDVKPLDIALDPAFELQARRTEANELALRYRAIRTTRAGHVAFAKGDGIEFLLSTPESIRGAVTEAKKIGGYCAGVLFFRWPGWGETLTAQPNEVLVAAGVLQQQDNAELEVVDRECAAVFCADLYLNPRRLVAEELRYRIESSMELEYFLPHKELRVRMSGPSRLEFSLPPYCGRGRLFLGRAVTSGRAGYRLKEEQ